MKKQFLLALALVISLGSIVAFKGTHNSPLKKYAVLTSSGDGIMNVEYEDKTVEVINKEKSGERRTTTQQLNIMASKGYKMVSSHGGDAYHVYIFERE